ncbi:cytochrome P450 [Hypoxylon argillaceum]|nr:cytochrome P450 [Hypoxylon argillaceum]
MSAAMPHATATYVVVILLIGLVIYYSRSTEGGYASASRRWIFYYVRRLRGLLYLVAGPRIIEEAYAQAKGKTFIVPTPSNDYLMVTSSELIREVTEAPPASLSLHAVAKEMLQPKYTMQGFEWQDQRGLEGTGFVRALRSLLTSHLPYFQPSIDMIIRDSLANELKSSGENGFVPVRIFPAVKRIVTRANSLVFFGQQLSENDQFTAAALEFPQIVIFAAEVLRITPGFLRSFVASLATNRHRAANILCRHLEPIVREPDHSCFGKITLNERPKVDCIQWIIDTSPRKNPWSPMRMVGEIMAVWFSTVHQLAMTATYMVQDLCLHDEYIEPLRQELRDYLVLQAKPGALIDVERLPLLDSFIKESIRCTNADAISCRRKALSPYVLQDGSRVEKGDWVCIPQLAMMHDAQRYASPHEFRGFRFAQANEAMKEGRMTAEVPDIAPASLTTATVEWPMWGLGIATCPGRFYASLVLKLVALQILDEWECKMIWRSSIVPRTSTVVLFRRRPISLQRQLAAAQDSS